MSTQTRFQVGDTVRYTYIAVPDDETIEARVLWLTPGGSQARLLVTKSTARYPTDSTVQLFTCFLRPAS